MSIFFMVRSAVQLLPRVFAFGLWLGACSPQADVVPHVSIQPGDRTQFLPGVRRRLEGEGAHVSVLRPGDELSGPNAMGRVGDVVLANREVVFVLDQIGGGAGFAESGGNLVDAADAGDRKDELGQVFTFFSTFPRQAVYTELRTVEDPLGNASVRVRGHELVERDLEVETEYRLGPEGRALLVTTTLRNGGVKEISGLALGDAVQWGGAEKFAPGLKTGFRGPSQGAFLGGVGRLTSYVLLPVGGGVEGISGGSWTDTFQKREVRLRKGESVSYARFFGVGKRADAASVEAEVSRLTHREAGALLVEVHGPEGQAVEGPLRLLLRRDDARLDVVRTHSGLFSELLPGVYSLVGLSGEGRVATSLPASVEIQPGKTTRARATVSKPAEVSVGCYDTAGAPLPCKVTFEGLANTPSPDWGSPHVAGSARNQMTLLESTKLRITPGSYRVTLSRGPEYALSQWDALLRAGDALEGCVPKERCVLTRVVDTAGFLAMDFHQHTMRGADAPVSTRDRVISNVVEGVEVAVLSEHNVVASLEGEARSLGVAGRFRSIPGVEITTDAAEKPWGHANVFPLLVEDGRPRGGAFSVRGRSALEVLSEARGRREQPLIQVNHPRSGANGYFDQLGFDRASGMGRDAGYFSHFDLLEVWNGRNVHEREKVLLDWFSLLRNKRFVVPTANTDTHGIVGQEAGYPRTYVAVASGDDPALLSPGGLVGDLRRGHVVLTNGPMVRVSRGRDNVVGTVERVSDPSVTLRVSVTSAPWVKFDTVSVLRLSDHDANASKLSFAWQKKVTPHLKDGALTADVPVKLPLLRDDIWVVVVSGQEPMVPVLSGDPAEIAPWAMTGLIVLDKVGDSTLVP